MVFSSAPLYLNPPNWQQGNEIQNPPLPEPNKPGTMGERARLGKAPALEGPLRCPRPGCESTNTKFCYFNNYNLSQPRHFCKSCRRYWTRGGALRNVPVGGACRRNKRRKSGDGAARSKSPKPASAAGGQQQQVVMNPVGPVSVSVSAPPYSLMTSLGMGNMGQLGYGAGLGQQQVSFLAGLTAPSYSGYPFQLSEGGMETASFGKGVMSMSMSKPLLGMGGGVTENVGQFWSAHIDNRTALGNGSGGLWTDLSGIN